MTTWTRAAAAALTLGAIGAVGLSASPADAAWTTNPGLHNAVVYVCKAPHANGTVTIKIKLDARKSAKWSSVGVSLMNAAGTQEVRGISARAQAGTVSPVKQITVPTRTKDRLSIGVSDAQGGMGGALMLGSTAHC